MPRTVRGWLLARLGLLAALALPTLWSPSLRAQETAGFDVNQIETRITQAVQGNPKLAGAWLFVTADGGDPAATRKLTFHCVLDRCRAAQQGRELERLIRTWLPEGTYWLDTTRDQEFPYSELIAELQIRVETDPLLGGCSITGGYYAPDTGEADKLDLVLRGRIAKESQTVEIERLCGHLMRGDAAWLKPPADGGESPAETALAISPKSSELSVVEPSDALGRAYYADGLNAFWKRHYAQAACSFRLAALESPRKLVYYYWWTLADLAGGDADTAGRRMRMVAKRFREADFDRQSTEYRDVVRSLERVQGPLRRALLELESRALFADSQTSAE
ncbi:MAG TPA: hypothetical protein VND64_12625 [Pirellulales bacterium]|nr:hypothetical protein [Pirellulales bacterium]